MKKMLLLFLLLGSHFCFAQFRNSIWCFGDSAGIDFNNINNPLPTYSLMDGRGTCVSIADSNGQLLFYASTRAGVSGGKSTIIRNYTGNIMQNGDSIVGGGWYHELLIIPMPNDVSKFYLFSVGVTSFYGLFYSIIDITADSGRGAITQKNIQVNNYSGVDAVAAVKHGNGRDWWLIFQKWDIPNNQFYKYLITPNGIIFNQVQAIGGIFSTNNANFTFFDNGSKILYTTFTGLVETMEFDRCTGLLYNEEIIEQEIIANPLKKYFGSVVSSNGSKIYLCSNSDTSYLIQFDLNAANIAGSKDTIFEFTNVLGEGGTLRLAPDHKIYLSNAWNDGVNYNYPYPTDSPSHNFINMNLSVINSP
ncbi:MAG: hypothetical protein ABI763_10365, partial [Bacteroidota bacterium]